MYKETEDQIDWFKAEIEDSTEEMRKELQKKLGLNDEEFEEAIRQNNQYRTGPISGYRERRYYEFFDTVFDTNGRKRNGLHTEVFKEVRAFRNTHIGTNLTNLQIPAALASDQTFIIEKLRSKVMFDAPHEQAERLFSMIEMGSRFKVLIGEKPLFYGDLKWEDSNKKDAPRLARSYCVDFGETKIHIPARQCFEVLVEFDDELVKELNYFTRQKIMRVYICGQQNRDIA